MRAKIRLGAYLMVLPYFKNSPVLKANKNKEP